MTEQPFRARSAPSALAWLLLATLPTAAAPADWENPRLTGVKNLPPHATMVVCPDAKTALTIGPVSNTERVKSPFYRSLNGAWKYYYASNHSARVRLGRIQATERLPHMRRAQ